MNVLYQDIRTGKLVRIIKRCKDNVVMVMRLDNKTKYITDRDNLHRLNF